MSVRPSPFDLWQQATDECGISQQRSERYRELMVEHGHIIPGEPKPLPCGWSPSQDPTSHHAASEIAPSAPVRDRAEQWQASRNDAYQAADSAPPEPTR